MTTADAKGWEQTAETYGGGRYMDPAMAQHVREVNLELIRRWAPQVAHPRILKTDLFAEATCPERAFSWFIDEAAQLCCFDIAHSLTLRGRRHALDLGMPPAAFATADARHLPFRDCSFDLIVSDSTLDHFDTVEGIDISLGELTRVLKPGGVMIVTLDNPHNLTNPLFRLWLRGGSGPYFIGKTLTRRQLVASLHRCGLRVTDTTAQFHYPRFVTKATLRVARRIAPRMTDRLAGRVLASCNRLERWSTRYLTGLFVAARAEKPISR